MMRRLLDWLIPASALRLAITPKEWWLRRYYFLRHTDPSKENERYLNDEGFRG